MIDFNNNKVRVRCIDCKEEHFIEVNQTDIHKEPRSIGTEYEHTFNGELKCKTCGADMKLEIIIYEYPKGFLNYIDIGTKSCIELDSIKEQLYIDETKENTFVSTAKKTSFTISDDQLIELIETVKNKIQTMLDKEGKSTKSFALSQSVSDTIKTYLNKNGK
jgi:hypothetical protein